MNRSRRWAIAIAGITPFTAPHASADVVQFSDTSVTALAGFNYAVDPERNYSATIENFTALSFGDSYAFLDLNYFPPKQAAPPSRTSFYFEWRPRFSLGKVVGFLPKGGLFRDFLLSGNLEQGKGTRKTRALAGVAMDLNGIGQFFQINLYRRNELHGRGFDGWQLTPVFAFPFAIDGQNYLVDGYTDIVFASKSKAGNLHFNPQVKWNAYSGTGNLWLGVELDVWTNKYGIRDSDRFNTNQKIAWSLIARYHF